MTNQTSPTNPAKHAFQADVSEVLKLVIHSLYSHREIFLRELISNASDALDKLRFRSLTEPDLLKDQANLEIRLRVDEVKKTLSIEDTGIGMTEEELITNLGTVAHSGSRAFLELAAKNPEGKKDLNLIGQFGVGFYSSYLVAERVEVITRAAGGEQSFIWSSNGSDSFTVEPATRTARGTEVILYFRDEHKELLETWQVRELVRRYSDFVSWPIKVEVIAQKTEKEPNPEPKWEQINRASALWQRPKSEITEEQYNDFYRHLSHDFQPPLARSHFRVEGSQEFVGLLYLPQHAPFDLNDPKRKRGVRLFVRRVFIMDECEELVPTWLRFVRGVIDSNDLPLNVSRELLQDSRILAAIKKQVIKKTLDMIEDLATNKPDQYPDFWKSIGVILKEGLAIDAGEYKERIGGLLRFQSSFDSSGKLTSLAEYVGRMPKDKKPTGENGDSAKGEAASKGSDAAQGVETVAKEGEATAEGSETATKEPAEAGSKEANGNKAESGPKGEIYYLIGESRAALEGSPHIEALRSRGLEVLFMTDPVDEWAVQHLYEFQGHRLVNAMQADLKLDTPEEEKKERDTVSATIKPLVERMEKVLKEKVREVKLSSRLTDSPCCLVIGFGGNSPFLERLLKERKMGMPNPKRVFEINPKHPVMTGLSTLIERDPASSRIDEWIQLLYDQALLAEGSVIEDAPAFARRVATLLTQAATDATQPR